jgi:hypothetical protein
MGAESNQAMSQPETGTDVSREKANVWSMMAGVFTSPQQAFTKFDRSPKIIVPLVVFLVLTFVFSVFSAQYGAKAQYDMFVKYATLPQATMERMEQSVQEGPSPVKGAIGAVATVIPMIFFALFAWGIGNFVFGGQTSFKKIFGVTILGNLIVAIGNLVKLPLMMAKDSIYVSLGVAALFPDKDFTSLFYSFSYYMLDLFAIWSLIVTGLGLAVIYRFATGRGITISIIASLLIAFAWIGLTAFGLGFAGIDIKLF